METDSPVTDDVAPEIRKRKIIYIDMDAFYASVEQRDNPELCGKPVIVGGERGVVAAASYEARKFAVRSAMPSVTGKRQCPNLIFVKPRFEVYRAISQQIREIFAEPTPIIEPSLNEAYLDVTENLQRISTGADPRAHPARPPGRRACAGRGNIVRTPETAGEPSRSHEANQCQHRTGHGIASRTFDATAEMRYRHFGRTGKTSNPSSNYPSRRIKPVRSVDQQSPCAEYGTRAQPSTASG